MGAVTAGTLGGTLGAANTDRDTITWWDTITQ